MGPAGDAPPAAFAPSTTCARRTARVSGTCRGCAFGSRPALSREARCFPGEKSPAAGSTCSLSQGYTLRRPATRQALPGLWLWPFRSQGFRAEKLCIPRACVCVCVRDNPCFPPGMRMCGCDECVIREDTLGWSVVGTLEREVLGRDCIMESGVEGGTPGEGGGLTQFQPRARSLVEGQGMRRWAYGHLPGVIISRLVFLL